MGSGTTGKPHRAWVSAWVVHGGCMVGAMVEWMLGVFLNDVLHHLGLVGGGE